MPSARRNPSRTHDKKWVLWAFLLTVVAAVAACAGPEGGRSASTDGRPDSSIRFPEAAAADFGLEAEVGELSDSLAAWVESGRIVGGEVLVVAGDRTVWHEAVGWADVEEEQRLEPNSIF